MSLDESVLDYSRQLNNNQNSGRTTQEKKWALLAGRAAFSLESYIFKSVLPAAMIKPYIFPRAIADMESLLSENTSTDLQNAAMKWEKLKTSLNWSIEYEQVISSAKHSYLLIKPSPEILHELNEECRHSNNAAELQKALATVLPIQLREPGEKVAAIIVKLGLP